MMDGTLEMIDGRPALRFERRLAHPVDRVWRAITEPDELEAWFVARPEWTPAEGETFNAMEQDGEITDVEPPNLLAWNWGGELFRFELSAAGDGCLLVFTHVFDGREFGAQHATGWEVHFARLDALLDGRALSEEEAMEDWAALHERYAERFGLDPEVGRRALAAYEEGGPEAVLEEMDRG
jgi:uncharacterized protein YndB with AHSA1/START domain